MHPAPAGGHYQIITALLGNRSSLDCRTVNGMSTARAHRLTPRASGFVCHGGGGVEPKTLEISPHTAGEKIASAQEDGVNTVTHRCERDGANDATQGVKERRPQYGRKEHTKKKHTHTHNPLKKRTRRSQ